ncbi:hypothetical protein IP88_02755 [alpha proteobacterium AAP81b]|nr:hypothetical protein IP88_02755 [alpha proteobacterium AAP81b]
MGRSNRRENAMPNFRRRTPFAIAALLLVAAPATAATSLANFTAGGATNNIRLVNNGTGSPDSASSGTSVRLYSTTTGSSNTRGVAAVNFSFLTAPLSTSIASLPAWFELDASATATPATVYAGTIAQAGLAGYFVFTARSAFVSGGTNYAAGTQLLRADFTAASLSGAFGGSSATLASTPGGDVTLVSDLASFGFADGEGFSFALTGLTNSLIAAGSGTVGDPYRALRSFRAIGSGEVEADRTGAVSAVPEPETWALLIAGFVMIGYQQRHRRRPNYVTG